MAAMYYIVLFVSPALTSEFLVQKNQSPSYISTQQQIYVECHQQRVGQQRLSVKLLIHTHTGTSEVKGCGTAVDRNLIPEYVINLMTSGVFFFFVFFLSMLNCNFSAGPHFDLKRSGAFCDPTFLIQHHVTTISCTAIAN